MPLSFSPSIIGMVHIGPLPGTPWYGTKGDYAAVRAKAISDALALAEGGAHGALVQNRDDRVFPSGPADPVVAAAFADITRAVADAVGDRLAVGVQVLRNDLRASIAIAHICGGSFVRCGVLVGSSAGVTGDPYGVLNYRRQIGAEKVQLIAEIGSMHFHGDTPLGELAQSAAFAGVDAVGIAHPDESTGLAWAREVKSAAPNLPLVIGGYTNAENIGRYLEVADGAFVGGAFEDGGRGGAVNPARVKAFMQAIK